MEYVLFIFKHHTREGEHVCASVLVIKRSLIFGRINILRPTTNCMGYIMFILTHRGPVCERAFASTCMFKRSLIFGKILFKFAKNIQDVAQIYMGYVLTLLTRRPRVCERECVNHAGMYALSHHWTDFLQIW
jgi:hypothetical protein